MGNGYSLRTGGGHRYLAAIINLYSRIRLVANTMRSKWCKECLEMAIMQHRVTEIINTDQCSQFICPVFTDYVESLDRTKFSMDGKRDAIDILFIERFLPNIKYEKIYPDYRRTDMNYTAK